MIERDYCIHDIVRFRIISKKIYRRMNLEYENFEASPNGNPDFIITIKDFVPNLENTTIIDKTFYIGKEYFYCKDSFKFGKWKIEATGLESDTIHINLWTNFAGRQFADMFICAFVIDFFIRFICERKGYSVIHASAMSRNGKAVMFPSQSGAGKTTTAIYLAEKGYDYLGDDFVIVCNGQIFCYPTPLNIFAYNLNPVIKKNLSSMERIIIKIKNFFYKSTASKIKIFTKLNPKNIPGLRVIDKSDLKAIYLLAQAENFEITEIDPELIINSILINQKLESFPFFKYLLEYAYVFPDSGIAQFWNTCERNLFANLKGVGKIYYAKIPRNYSKNIFTEFKEAIECGN